MSLSCFKTLSFLQRSSSFILEVCYKLEDRVKDLSANKSIRENALWVTSCLGEALSEVSAGELIEEAIPGPGEDLSRVSGW